MNVIVNSKCLFAVDEHTPIKGGLDFYFNLFSCLGYEQKLPISDWLRKYHGLSGKWLVVSPVFWQATHNDVVLTHCSTELDCSEDALRMLYDDFSRFAAIEGMQTYFHNNYTWLLQCDNKPRILSRSPHYFLHQSLFSELRILDDLLYWQRFLTAVQMLFAQRALGVNGVWIWGDDLLPMPLNQEILVSSQALYDMASLLSHRVDLLSSRPDVIKGNVLFLFDEEWVREGYSAFEKRLSASSVHWYWNDIAYKVSKPSWFSRLISFKDKP
jgi:hypothetical protein